MSIRFAAFAIGLTVWLSAAPAWAAPPMSRTFIRDVNCTPTRITLMYRPPAPWPGYTMPYYQPTVAFLPTAPPVLPQMPVSALPASDSDRPSTSASARMLPRPSGIAERRDDDAAVAPANR